MYNAAGKPLQSAIYGATKITLNNLKSTNRMNRGERENIGECKIGGGGRTLWAAPLDPPL